MVSTLKQVGYRKGITCALQTASFGILEKSAKGSADRSLSF